MPWSSQVWLSQHQRGTRMAFSSLPRMQGSWKLPTKCSDFTSSFLSSDAITATDKACDEAQRQRVRDPATRIVSVLRLSLFFPRINAEAAFLTKKGAEALWHLEMRCRLGMYALLNISCFIAVVLTTPPWFRGRCGTSTQPKTRTKSERCCTRLVAEEMRPPEPVHGLCNQTRRVLRGPGLTAGNRDWSVA